MGADVHIRSAEPDDAKAISAIGRAALPAQYRGLVDPEAVRAAVGQTYSVEAVVDCIDRCHAAAEPAEFLVAEREGVVEGYLHFDSFGPEPELHRLYVSSDARGGGIGAQLMEELQARLPADLRYMLLVLEGNDRAVAFYEKHGFHIDGFVDGLAYYNQRMAVKFPASTQPFRLVLMRQEPMPSPR